MEQPHELTGSRPQLKQAWRLSPSSSSRYCSIHDGNAGAPSPPAKEDAENAHIPLPILSHLNNTRRPGPSTLASSLGFVPCAWVAVLHLICRTRQSGEPSDASAVAASAGSCIASARGRGSPLHRQLPTANCQQCISRHDSVLKSPAQSICFVWGRPRARHLALLQVVRSINSDRHGSAGHVAF